MDICFQGSTSSGIDFAEKIAQSHSQTKFIYVTGHPREYLQQIFMSKTVNPFGYLPKPFDRKAVQDYLQKIRAASADSQDLFPFKPKMSVGATGIPFWGIFPRRLFISRFYSSFGKFFKKGGCISLLKAQSKI